MPLYNFKKKVKFYVVSDGLKYQLEINPDLSFSQTFTEESRRVKTLHAPKDMFDRASISIANPANFNFTMPLYTTTETKPIFQLLLDYDSTTSETTMKTVDIYVDTGVEIFKLTKAVFERGTFNISNTQIVSVSISGTASQLSLYGTSGTAIPGSAQISTISKPFPSYLEQRKLQIIVNGVEQQHINGVSIEIANEVNWLPNNTLHKSLAVTGPSDTTYPEAFVVSGRVLSGLVQQYVTDVTRSNLNKWAIGVPLSIRVARDSTFVLKFEIPEAIYTNRIETGELFIQNYDFRMINSPSDLSTVIQYN